MSAPSMEYLQQGYFFPAFERSPSVYDEKIKWNFPLFLLAKKSLEN